MLPGEELPVDVPWVCPLHVLVVRGELDAETDVRAAMRGRAGSLRRPTAHAARRCRGEKNSGSASSRDRSFSRLLWDTGQQPFHQRVGVHLASARAWKLSTSRCRSTGAASARGRRNQRGTGRRSAHALAPSTRHCDARGLAP
jgi:hypothetical protein